MLNEPVLIDTGPLISIYSSDDLHHSACIDQLGKLPVGKTYTCWSVVTEAAYMLRRHPAQRDDLLQSIIDGDLLLFSLRDGDLKEVRDIFQTYRDQQLDLADAALLHLANREGISAVFTLDRRHFSVFRRQSGQPLHLLPDSL